MNPKQVVIVNEGTFKSQNPNEYQAFIKLLKRQLEAAKPAAIVTVVETKEEALNLASMKLVSIVIFVSVQMYEYARELQLKFKDLKVLVLTGIPVSGQPYVIHKLMINADSIKSILLI